MVKYLYGKPLWSACLSAALVGLFALPVHAQGVPGPYQYAICVATSTDGCMQYDFAVVPDGTSTPIVPYGGADFYEWLLMGCIIIAPLYVIAWRLVFSPVTKAYGK